MTSRIWLGDASRVLRRLQPDDGSAPDLLALLGLSRSAAEVTVASVRSRPRPRIESPPTRPTAAAPPALAPPPPSDWLTSTAAAAEPARVEVIEPAPVPVPELPELTDVLMPPAETALASANLFDPTRQRALLSTVTSVRVRTGELDVPRLAELACAGRPIVALPMLSRWTNRRGLQVLVDVGGQLDLFARDQRELVESIRRTAGPDGLQSLSFRCSPLAEAGAGDGPIWTWRRYQPPRPGIAVLALTDLGAFSPDDVRTAVQREWLGLAARLTEQGSRLVVLAPTPLDRFPPWLRRRLSIVSWDRTTRVGEVLAAVRRSDRQLQRR